MARARTAAQLKVQLTIAEAREAARKAAVASVTPKTYEKKKPETNVLVSQVGSEGKIWVKMKVYSSTLTRLGGAGATALGVLAANTAIPANTQVVDFRGNHKKVLRVVVNEGIATPTVKRTAWGTRVVKHIDKSYQIPVGNDDLNDMLTAFNTFFAGAAGQALLGPAGSQGYATLQLGKSVLSTVERSGT
jgi:hypothetical protein